MAGEWRAADLAGVLAAFAARADLAGAAAAAAAAAAVRAAAAATRERNTPAGAARQHRPPLRPLQRAVRAVPGRDDDLLLRGVRAGRHAGRGAAAQVRTASATWLELGAGRSPARDRHRLGRHGHARGRAPRGCRVTTITVSPSSSSSWPSSGCARPAWSDHGGGAACATTARSTAASTRSSRSRCSRRWARRYWPTFFAACDRLLAPGGRMALQTITMPHGRYLASRRSYTWIHKYIFPGGLIPSRGRSTRRWRGSRAAGDRLGADRRALRAHAARLAGAVRRAASTRCARSASTTPSAACGSSTWPTARPDSRPGALGDAQSAVAGAAVSFEAAAVWVTGASERHRRRARDRAVRAARRTGGDQRPAGARSSSSWRPSGRGRAAGAARRHRPRGGGGGSGDGPRASWAGSTWRS